MWRLIETKRYDRIQTHCFAGGSKMISRSRMWRFPIRGLVVLLLLVAGGPADGDELSPSPGGTSPASATDVTALAQRLDGFIADKLAAAGVTPVGPADDAEFLRRLTLDLLGRLPTVAEVRAALGSTDADRHSQWIDARLASPECANRLAAVLCEPFGFAEGDAGSLNARRTLEYWLRAQLLADRGWDEIVRDLVATEARPISQGGNRINFGRGATPQLDRPSPADFEEYPLAFLQNKEAKPAELAAVTMRVFLGVRMECAQCHDHPFSHWKREEFWSQAAFFAGMRLDSMENLRMAFGIDEDLKVRQIKIDDEDQIVSATYLGGGAPEWPGDKISPRRVFADWLTSPTNPYFARATVNRLWAICFGRGLVEPVDDFDDRNPPSHPEALDLLASEFVAGKMQLRPILAAIVRTAAYQRSSETPPAPGASELLGSMPVRALDSRQLHASLVQVRGRRARTGEFSPFYTDEIVRTSGSATSPIQALELMNGGLAQTLQTEQANLVIAVADYPEWTTAERVETLFLATLSRPPSEEESARFVRYVDELVAAEPQPAANETAPVDPAPQPPAEESNPVDKPTSLATSRRAALADVLWALANSGEFQFNH